jgi:hypothetical protein
MTRETLTGEPNFAILFPACEKARRVRKRRAELPRRKKSADEVCLHLAVL